MAQKNESARPDPAKDPQVKELTVQTDQLLAVSANYRVATVEDYQVAGGELQRVKGAQRRLDDIRRAMTRPLDEAKRAIMDFFRGPEEKLARAESGIKRAMLAFQSEQDRKRREEQARADEAARKEQQRLAQQAQRAAARRGRRSPQGKAPLALVGRTRYPSAFGEVLDIGEIAIANNLRDSRRNGKRCMVLTAPKFCTGILYRDGTTARPGIYYQVRWCDDGVISSQEDIQLTRPELYA